jgi:putative hemolysin
MVKSLLYSMLKQKLKKFHSNIDLHIDKQDYIIKTAETMDDLLIVLNLRYKVFIEELLHKKKSLEFEVDRFDMKCDHLMIIHKETHQVIGTYRLNSSLFTKRFYSATEFHMRHLAKLPGNKLEVDRACVHQDYRNGRTIALLWEGLNAYMVESKSRYMFGCSSVRTMNRGEMINIYRYFQDKGYIIDNFKINPKRKFQIPSIFHFSAKNSMKELTPATDSEIEKIVPSLLKSYLKAGAKICGKPALDRKYRCIDFFTLMEKANFKTSYQRGNKE